MVSILVTSQSFSGGTNFFTHGTNVARPSYVLPLNVFINIGVVLGGKLAFSAGPHTFLFPHFGIYKFLMVYQINEIIRI